MGQVVVYPGTFDPVTLGHEEIAQRASILFPRVVIAIAESARKRPLFPLSERVAMAKKALSLYQNVEVVGFTGLLLQCMKKLQAHIVIRGLRAGTDFEYEFQLAGMNRQQNAALETLFLIPSAHNQFVSSSMVREILLFGGDISPFVNPLLVQYIHAHHEIYQEGASDGIVDNG